MPADVLIPGRKWCLTRNLGRIGEEVRAVSVSECDLVREMVGGEPYEYYPLGEYIVRAPGVCGGRPTFKYTRIDVRHAIDLIAGGWTLERVAEAYRLPTAAVQEALELAAEALARQAG
jgi:uncharacterized protein (DUF433 family)